MTDVSRCMHHLLSNSKRCKELKAISRCLLPVQGAKLCEAPQPLEGLSFLSSRGDLVSQLLSLCLGLIHECPTLTWLNPPLLDSCIPKTVVTQVYTATLPNRPPELSEVLLLAHMTACLHVSLSLCKAYDGLHLPSESWKECQDADLHRL